MGIHIVQTCFSVYFVLAVPAFFLVWATLVVAKESDEKMQEHGL